jgi:hypothetical protein
MGYETRMIVGILDEYINEDPAGVMEIARINLCKTGIFVDTYIDKERDTQRVYIYADDGDKRITEDQYGSPLLAVPPKDVLRLMVAANKVSPYRRFKAAIPMLRSLIKGFKGENLVCILFGY